MADVADHFRTFAEHCLPAEGRVSIDSALIDGPDAVLIGTSTQRLKATGNRFTMTLTLHLTIEDGRITRHHTYKTASQSPNRSHRLTTDVASSTRRPFT